MVALMLSTLLDSCVPFLKMWRLYELMTTLGAAGGSFWDLTPLLNLESSCTRALSCS